MDLRGCVILQPRYPGRRLCQMSSERKQTPGLFQTKKNKIFEKKMLHDRAETVIYV